MSRIEEAVYNWMQTHTTAWDIIDGVVVWTAIVMAALIALYLIATELILVWEHHREKALPWMVKHGMFDEEDETDEGTAEGKQDV